jgi:hypothetical protein
LHRSGLRPLYRHLYSIHQCSLVHLLIGHIAVSEPVLFCFNLFVQC